MKKKILIVSAIILLALYPILYCVGYRKGSSSVVERTVRDTLVVYKTKTITQPTPLEIKSIGTIFLPLVVERTDTTRETQIDTLFAPVTKEQKHYHEDDLYDCWVSGVDVALDSLNIMQKETTITNRVPVPTAYRNSVYLQSNTAFNSQFTSSLTLNYERQWKYCSVYGGAGYDFILKKPLVQAGLKIKFDW